MLSQRDLTANGRLVLGGADRARFLHGMVTNDVIGLTPGQGCHAAMLTVKGKLLGDLYIFVGEQDILVETDALATAKIHEALVRHVIMDDVVVEDRGQAIGELALYGDEAASAIAEQLGCERTRFSALEAYRHVDVGSLCIAAVRELGLDGYRLLGDVAAIGPRLGGRALSSEEIEVLRVEAGEPRYGHDMGEDHLPIESRLDSTISFTKGCYLGQEVIVRATQQGRINRKLMGLRVEGDTAAEIGAVLSGPGRAAAGTVTSSVVSPRFGSIALGYVHRTLWAPGTLLTLHEVDGSRAATVAELPFS